MILPPLITTKGEEQRLEAVLVCVGVSGVLNITLNNNVRHFDHVLVATTPEDIETQAVCKKYDVTCLQTSAFKKDGFRFNKGAAHEECLKNLKFNEFVVFLDPDIILDYFFRSYIVSLRLDVNFLYGMDRVIVTNDKQLEILEEGNLCGPLSPEWGFGYFQLFHMRSKWLKGKERLCPYKDGQGIFGGDDYFFREQFGGPHYFLDGVHNWDRRAQCRLALWCYHLGEKGVESKCRPLDPPSKLCNSTTSNLL